MVAEKPSIAKSISEILSHKRVYSFTSSNLLKSHRTKRARANHPQLLFTSLTAYLEAKMPFLRSHLLSDMYFRKSYILISILF
jgi:hypothetical protein